MPGIFDIFGNYFATRGQDPETWGLFLSSRQITRQEAICAISVQFCNPDGTCKETKVLDEFLALFDACKPVGRNRLHRRSLPLRVLGRI